MSTRKFKSTANPTTAPARSDSTKRPGPTTRFIDEVLPIKARLFVVGDGDHFDEWGNDVRGCYVMHSAWDVYKYLNLDPKPEIAFIRFVPSERYCFDNDAIISAIAGICYNYPYMKTLDFDPDDGDCVVLLAQDEGIFVRTLKAMDWFAGNSAKYFAESKYYREEDTFD